MKILVTVDLHVHSDKWRRLVQVTEGLRPDVVAIAGDLLPKFDGILAETRFLKSLRKYAKKIRDTGAELVLTLGNDDNQLVIPDMYKGDDEGLWHYVEDKIIAIDGYEFVGMPYVPDYPFGYKFWCRAEYKNKPDIDQLQLSRPVIVNANNEYEKIDNYKQYLRDHLSIDEELKKRASQVKDMRKSIWLIHAPPRNSGLDSCINGMKVGSRAIRKFLEEQQPLLSIHGHIHESPEVTRKWYATFDKTLSIQPGQGYDGLNYVMLDFGHDMNGDLVTCKHSVYSDELVWSINS